VDVTDNDWASYMATYAGFAIGALYQWPSRPSVRCNSDLPGEWFVSYKGRCDHSRW
jgi:hypothetical protein